MGWCEHSCVQPGTVWCFSSGFGKDLPYSCLFFRMSRFDCLTIGEVTQGVTQINSQLHQWTSLSETLLQLVLHFQTFLDMETELHLMKWISVLKCNPSWGGWGQAFLIGALIESPRPRLDVGTTKMQT